MGDLGISFILHHDRIRNQWQEIQTVIFVSCSVHSNLPGGEELDEYGLSIGHGIVVIGGEGGYGCGSSGGGEGEDGGRELHGVVVIP